MNNNRSASAIGLNKDEFLLELMEYVLQCEPVMLEDAYNDFNILPYSLLFSNTFTGFIRFLQKYSAIFTLTVDGYICVSTGSKDSTKLTTSRTAVEFFKDILLRSPNGKCRLNSLFGHRSQATASVKEQIGKTETSFKKFLLSHPHDFLFTGDYVCLADLNNEGNGYQHQHQPLSPHELITCCDGGPSNVSIADSEDYHGGSNFDISGHQSGVIESLQPSYGFVRISSVLCYFTRENVCEGITGANMEASTDFAQSKTDLEAYFTINEQVDCIVMRANGACPWKAVQISKFNVQNADSAINNLGGVSTRAEDVMDSEAAAFTALLNLHRACGEMGVMKVIAQCFTVMPNLRSYLTNELNKSVEDSDNDTTDTTPPASQVTNIVIKDSECNKLELQRRGSVRGVGSAAAAGGNKLSLSLDITERDKASSCGDDSGSDAGEEDTDECYSSRTNDSIDVMLDQEPELKNMSGIVKIIHHSYGIIGLFNSDCYFTKIAVVELSGLPRKQRKVSLTRVFQLGDKVCCNAVVAEDISKAKWRALQVWRAPT